MSRLVSGATCKTGSAVLTGHRTARSGSGEGIGFTGTGRRTTTRLLDAQFPPYRSLLPTEFSVTAEVSVATLTEAVKRVALVADRGNPVRLDFADGGVTLRRAGGTGDLRTLDVWDGHLAEHGAELLAARMELACSRSTAQPASP